MVITLSVGGVSVACGADDPSITIRSTNAATTLMDTRDIAHQIGLLAYRFLDPIQRESCRPGNEIGFYRTVGEEYSPETGELVAVWRISHGNETELKAFHVAVIKAMTRCNVYLRSDTIAV